MWISDATYVDPLGPQPLRPRTGAKKMMDLEDFGNDDLGDDLLPEWRYCVEEISKY